MKKYFYLPIIFNFRGTNYKVTNVNFYAYTINYSKLIKYNYMFILKKNDKHIYIYMYLTFFFKLYIILLVLLRK